MGLKDKIRLEGVYEELLGGIKFREVLKVPVVDVVEEDVGDKTARTRDLLRSVSRLEEFVAGEDGVSVKDELLAIEQKRKILELIGRWNRYEESVVNNNQQNNTVINIIRG
jgi:hypothetical protein